MSERLATAIIPCPASKRDMLINLRTAMSGRAVHRVSITAGGNIEVAWVPSELGDDITEPYGPKDRSPLEVEVLLEKTCSDPMEAIVFARGVLEDKELVATHLFIGNESKLGDYHIPLIDAGKVPANVTTTGDLRSHQMLVVGSDLDLGTSGWKASILLNIDRENVNG